MMLRHAVGMAVVQPASAGIIIVSSIVSDTLILGGATHIPAMQPTLITPSAVVDSVNALGIVGVIVLMIAGLAGLILSYLPAHATCI